MSESGGEFDDLAGELDPTFTSLRRQPNVDVPDSFDAVSPPLLAAAAAAGVLPPARRSRAKPPLPLVSIAGLSIVHGGPVT